MLRMVKLADSLQDESEWLGDDSSIEN